MKQTLIKECERLQLTLSEQQLSQFTTYAEELIEKNKVMNLTAITEPEAIAKLHFADCLAMLNIIEWKNKSVIDVGCGAGFPGVVLKIGEPSIRLTLLDSLQKRIYWLCDVLQELHLNAVCAPARAEEYPHREEYDIATSRAVARLNVLCELCLPFVKVGGYFLAMKAAAADEELEEAKNAIKTLGGQFERMVEYEIDGAMRRVLVIRKVKHTPGKYPRRFSKIKQEPL